MTGIDSTRQVCVNELTIGSYSFKQTLKLRMNEIAAQLVDALINLLRQLRIVDDCTNS